MSKKTTASGKVIRIQTAERRQVEYRPWSLDQLIAGDHRVRTVWSYVESLDLSSLYESVDSVAGKPGRDAVDPRILFSLWMFATIESVTSARQLDRLCQRDLAYMWLCGGVGVNYHLLSDFRTAHGDLLDVILTDTIATLLHQGLINLEVVAQDGVRVRASAGTDSFRREKTLKEHHAQAKSHVESLTKIQSEHGHQSENSQAEAAAQRAAREREARIAQALKELPELQEKKEKRKEGTGKDARCSTTDPESRNMKMGDGGFRPAFNVQLGTDGGTRMIVDLDVTNSGSDRGEMAKMHQTIVQKYKRPPKQYLVDCGFATKNDITQVEQQSKVLAPVQAAKKRIAAGKDPFAKQKGDSPEMVQFRQRMKTEEAKTLYKQRASIAEFPNAEFRNRGLTQFRTRGLIKVKTEALWQAITFNFMRMVNLGFLPMLKT